MNKENYTVDESVCNLTTSVPDYGKFIKEDDAKRRLDDYFTATGHKPDDEGFIYGQLLGLNAVKTLLSKIDTFNDTRDPAEKIGGIRIYNAMSKRPFLDDNNDEKLLIDVILMPVLANGKDLYTIHSFDDPQMILTDAMPCPNQCKTNFYKP